MGIGYTSHQLLAGNATQVVGASQSKAVVSKTIRISAEDSVAFRADLTAASTTGTVSVMLQTSHDGATWIDGKVVTVTDGNVTIAYLPNVTGDQTFLPLAPIGRIVCTTAAASGTTISSVQVAKRL